MISNVAYRRGYHAWEGKERRKTRVRVFTEVFNRAVVPPRTT
jgi:hypothetical protein